MGQYYEVMMNKEGSLVHLNRKVDGEYTGAKIMEHSWCGNYFCDTVTAMLLDAPARVIWMGDYADDDKRLLSGQLDDFVNSLTDTRLKEFIETKLKEEGAKMNPAMVLYKFRMANDGNGVQRQIPPAYEDLYLINNSKMEYVVMKDYIQATTDRDEWNIYPLAILTAIGNGNGGGDYWGRNMDTVGHWAGDEVLFSKTRPDETYHECNMEKYAFIEE